MQLTICEKHQKKEKLGPRILSGSNVCINRYCPNAYTIICPQCKNQHRDHSIKILTLEDINQLIKKLLKTPLALSNKYIVQSIDIMKKIKLIKQFRRKIDVLETDMVRQAVSFIDLTQTLIHQYAVSKQSVSQLADKLHKISDPQVFKQFKSSCHQYFSQIEYNFKKQKMELGNSVIKEKQEKRRKLLQITRRRIEQVKDYSMKIIQVILHNQDSEEDQQYADSMAQKRKYYKTLKEDLNSDIKIKDQIDEEGIKDTDQDQQQSKSTSVSAKHRKIKQCYQSEMQTEDQWITGLREQVIKTKNDLDLLKRNSEKNQNDLKDQINKLTKERQSLTQQVNAMSNLLQTEKKTMRRFYKRLQQNNKKINQVQFEKESIFRKIIQVHTTK